MFAPTPSPPVRAPRKCPPNTSARRRSDRVVVQVEVERLKAGKIASPSTCVNHFYLCQSAHLAGTSAFMSERNRERPALVPNPLASRSVSGKNASMSCLPQRQSNYSRLHRGNPSEWPRGTSPQALSEPYVNLSIHTAPSVQPPRTTDDLLSSGAHPPKS